MSSQVLILLAMPGMMILHIQPGGSILAYWSWDLQPASSIQRHHMRDLAAGAMWTSYPWALQLKSCESAWVNLMLPQLMDSILMSSNVGPYFEPMIYAAASVEHGPMCGRAHTSGDGRQHLSLISWAWFASHSQSLLVLCLAHFNAVYGCTRPKSWESMCWERRMWEAMPWLTSASSPCGSLPYHCMFPIGAGITNLLSATWSALDAAFSCFIRWDCRHSTL